MSFNFPSSPSEPFTLSLDIQKQIFYFFTEPFITYKIFHFVWTKNFEQPLFLSTKVDELELTLLDLREEFLTYFTRKQQKSRILSVVGRIGRRAANLPLMNFIEKYFLEYQNLAARKIPLDFLNARNTLLQALKDSSHPCAIKNPSRSLLKALRKQHEAKITPYVEFFVDLPYRVGYMTRPFLSGLDVLALNTNQFTELVSQDDLLPLSEQRNPPSFFQIPFLSQIFVAPY